MSRADRLVRKAHIWLGLCSGVLFLVFGITGALLEVQRPLWRAEFGEPAKSETPAPVSAWLTAAQASLPEGARIGGIMMPNGRLRTPWAVVRAVDQSGSPWVAIVDPSTATVAAAKPMARVMSLLPLRLHLSLAIDGTAGPLLVVFSGLALTLSAITAMIVWIPPGAWRRKAGSFEIRGPPKRRNYRVHSILGFWTLAPMTVLALTGAWLAYPVGPSALGPAVTARDCAMADADDLIRHAAAVAPRSRVVVFNLPESSDGTWMLHLREPGDHDAVLGDRVILAPARCTPDAVLFERSALSEMDRTHGLVRSIHAGHTGGPLGEIAVFLAGLALAVLPVSGTLHWYRTRRRPRRANATTPARTTIGK